MSDLIVPPHGLTEHGLGRLKKEDPKDRNFLMARKLPTPSRRTVRKWPRGGKVFPLDQGNTGTCVGHAWMHWMKMSPIRNKPTFNAFDLYRAIILLDEWTENDHEASSTDNQALQFGTSVRAGAKALRSKGALKEFSWAFEGNTARQWVLDVSPVVLGTDWTWNMMNVDKNGFVHPDGGLAGGHGYVWYGTDLMEKRDDGKRGVDYCLNSWGPWGISFKGIFKMRIEDTDALIKAQGEACTATETLLL